MAENLPVDSPSPASADGAGVVLTHAGAISTVTMDRPARRNALDAAGLEALADLLDGAVSRPRTRVVVLRGAGGAFCAGADLPDLPDGADADMRLGLSGDHAHTLNLIDRIITTLTRARVPAVAVVDGPAAGVGASFAFACDLVVASEPSFFVLPFAGIGLVPDGGATLTVAASIGRARAMRLALLGERLPAAQAVELGLIAQAVPRERLEEEANELVQRLAQGPTLALARTKQLINRATMSGLGAVLDAEAEVQKVLLDTPQHQEGVQAFRERRPADFPFET